MISTIQTLMKRKEDAEADLEAQVSILRSNGTDLRSPIVDREGFPRADMDIYAVRSARARVHELNNDLKALVDEIGKALENHYDPKNAVEEEAPTTTKREGSFAKVNAVAPKSPAAEAGLQRDDLVLKFGTLTNASFFGASLQPLADLVTASENRLILINVKREGKLVVLRLTPKQWEGRGTLGCHIVPHTEELT